MQRLCQFAAWVAVAAIALLLLGPAELARPETGFPHNFEHFAIFLATGMAFSIGYADRRWAQASGLVLFAGTVELGQFFAPGRHARLSDFVVNSAAVCIGVALVYALARARNVIASPVKRGRGS